MIKFVCSGCSKNLSVAPQHAGKRIKCPACQTVLTVPAEDVAAQSKPNASTPASIPTVKPIAPSRAIPTVTPIPAVKPIPKVAPVASTPPRPKSPQPIAPTANTGFGDALADLPPVRATPANFGPPPATSAGGGNFYGSAYGNQSAPSYAQPQKTSGWTFSKLIDSRAFLFGLVLIIGGPIASYFGFKQSAEVAMINDHGVVTNGEIHEAYEQRGRKGRRSYYFDVVYETQGNGIQQKKFSVGYKKFNQHCDDTSIIDPLVELRYLPEDPQTAYIVGEEGEPGLLKFGGLIAMFIGAGMVAYVFVSTPE